MERSKKSGLSWLIASLLLASLALVAWAGHGHSASGSHGHHGASHQEAAHAHHHMAEFIQQLNLNEDQQTRLAEIHELMANMGSGAMAAHHAQMKGLVERIDHQGSLNQVDVRVMIDQHIDQLRDRAYDIGDSLVELVDSLDDEQRATLHEHLSQLRSAHGEPGKGEHAGEHGASHH